MSNEPTGGETLDLSLPGVQSSSAAKWKVQANNRRVLKSWLSLCRSVTESMTRCYEHLIMRPDERIPGRCFPLKHSKYAGCWEFEVTGGDRVFYKMEEQTKTVLVYYAGPHPAKAPDPPG